MFNKKKIKELENRLEDLTKVIVERTNKCNHKIIELERVIDNLDENYSVVCYNLNSIKFYENEIKRVKESKHSFDGLDNNRSELNRHFEEEILKCVKEINRVKRNNL
jgi:hypothetical protein